jgi:hypothetical protein
MPSNSDSDLARLQSAKQRTTEAGAALGPELVGFFKHSVEKRQARFSRIAQRWGVLIPEMYNRHCALDSFSKGVLTVLVDSSSHLYQLKQLLLAGLNQQVLLACKSAGLRKIVLRPGRWYQGEAQDCKLRFDQ